MKGEGTRREIQRFLMVGCSTVVVDLSIYTVLFKLGVAVALAKGSGFLIGTLFAYFANKHWTFAGKGGEQSTVLPFLVIYGINIWINIGINQTILTIGPEGAITFYTAFVLATGASAVLNFIGMKLIVFRAYPAEG